MRATTYAAALSSSAPRAFAKTDALTSLGLAISVVLLFGVSGGMLWLLGYNYDGITGSAFTKIHPFSYLIVILVARQALMAGNPVTYGVKLVNLRPASAVLALVSLLLLAVSAERKAPGMAGVVDTFFIPAIFTMLMADADEPTLARMESLLHVMMTLNALLAIAEFLTKTQLFPYRFDGVLLVGDTRSSALQGHPLVNAFVTACYVQALLTGGRSLPNWLKLGLIGLQCAALVTFGGRSAIVVTALLGVLYVGLCTLRTLRRGRVSLRAAAVSILLLALLPVAFGELVAAGFFNALADRFVSDGGSAHARVEMFTLFRSIPLRALIVGPNVKLVDMLRWREGLESGIENPIVSMTLYHGAFLTLITLSALGLWLYELTRNCHRGVWLPMIAFLILLNASESIATKTTAVSKFAIILLCMYRSRQQASAFNRAAGAAPMRR